MALTGGEAVGFGLTILFLVVGLAILLGFYFTKTCTTGTVNPVDTFEAVDLWPGQDADVPSPGPTEAISTFVDMSKPAWLYGDATMYRPGLQFDGYQQEMLPATLGNTILLDAVTVRTDSNTWLAYKLLYDLGAGIFVLTEEEGYQQADGSFTFPVVPDVIDTYTDPIGSSQGLPAANSISVAAPGQLVVAYNSDNVRLVYYARSGPSTWDDVDLMAPTTNKILAFAVEPDDGTQLMVVANMDIPTKALVSFHSVDAGANWSPMVAFDPNTRSRGLVLKWDGVGMMNVVVLDEGDGEIQTYSAPFPAPTNVWSAGSVTGVSNTDFYWAGDIVGGNLTIAHSISTGVNGQLQVQVRRLAGLALSSQAILNMGTTYNDEDSLRVSGVAVSGSDVVVSYGMTYNDPPALATTMDTGVAIFPYPTLDASPPQREVALSTPATSDVRLTSRLSVDEDGQILFTVVHGSLFAVSTNVFACNAMDLGPTVYYAKTTYSVTS